MLKTLLYLKTPLGDDREPYAGDALHATELVLRERLSEPYEAIVTAVCEQPHVSPDQLLYKPATVTIHRDAFGGDRYVYGLVRDVRRLSRPQRERYRYQMRIVPPLWFLSQTEDCRIFQAKTVEAILQEIFAEHEIAPVRFQIYGDKPVREYVTQYNETDLDFVHRLLQESGWFYFFKQSDGEVTTIVTDRNQAFETLPEPEHAVVYQSTGPSIFSDWHDGLRTAHGVVGMQGFDPTRATAPIKGRQVTRLGTAGAAKRDMFRWPTQSLQDPTAQARSQYQIEAEEAAASLRLGQGMNPQFAPGTVFRLKEDPFSGGTDIEHAVVAVEHRASDHSWVTGGGAPDYDCSFEAVPKETNWREPLSLPRPRMGGVFSGIVLGGGKAETFGPAGGQEIHADEHSRIKVRLLFDRRAETDGGQATWVRVVQPWAGNGWGWQHIPRVGSEVAVAFMNGDPDDPVVLGGLYNSRMQAPYAVPSQQTITGIRSRSTLNGAPSEANEWYLDDKKGEELVYLHAQKDQETKVVHDQTSRIGRDRAVVTERNDDLTSTTGNVSIIAEAGSVTITAATTITLRVGTTSITLSEAGVAVQTTGTVTSSSTGATAISSLGAVAIDAVGAVTINAAAELLLDAGANFCLSATSAVIDTPEPIMAPSGVLLP